MRRTAQMLSRAASRIFQETLLRIDAGAAIRRAVRIDTSHLIVCGEPFSLDPAQQKIHVVAIGKAAFPMAAAFEDIAGRWIKRGIVSGQRKGVESAALDSNWEVFYGGHPLPNEESLAAARSCMAMLGEADTSDSIVVFLISGGGSAMMEMPRHGISLDDLRSLNQVLVTSGATIMEVNAVRRFVSEVKGGGLAKRAPAARQISLIISDTSAGDPASVASGPSLIPSRDTPEPQGVIEKYSLGERLPESVMRLFPGPSNAGPAVGELDSRIYVLLDNEYMVREASEIAKGLGFVVATDCPREDSNIVQGCETLLSKLLELLDAAEPGSTVCLISGGEFGCEVKGSGVGGRNSETVLRLARLARDKGGLSEFAILSCGSDGIDGNSPAAGAVADGTTLALARKLGIDPESYLESSDSFSFFEQTGGTVVTGPTGTNVRDIRILIARKG